jgi:hypothetical protein
VSTKVDVLPGARVGYFWEGTGASDLARGRYSIIGQALSLQSSRRRGSIRMRKEKLKREWRRDRDNERLMRGQGQHVGSVGVSRCLRTEGSQGR